VLPIIYTRHNFKQEVVTTRMVSQCRGQQVGREGLIILMRLRFEFFGLIVEMNSKS